MLAEVRNEAREPIPLVWKSEFTELVGCIEVYPAATLKTHDFPYREYKGAKYPRMQIRQRIIHSLGGHFKISEENIKKMEESDHAIDALVCILAAKDYLEGYATQPGDAEMEIAKQEGWIWLRRNI